MSQREPLFEISFHTDDDTGMYYIGEIDFSIYGTLDPFIEHFGFDGVKRISETLIHLGYEVMKRYFEQQEKENAGAAQAEENTDVPQ